jgi:hypothetical protein
VSTDILILHCLLRLKLIEVEHAQLTARRKPRSINTRKHSNGKFSKIIDGVGGVSAEGFAVRQHRSAPTLLPQAASARVSATGSLSMLAWAGN